jgi:hypothetical protein
MKNPLDRKLHAPPANRLQPQRMQKVDLAKLLRARLAPQAAPSAAVVQRPAPLVKNAPAPVSAPAQAIPRQDDGSYVTEEVWERLHREEVTRSIGAALSGPGVPLTPNWRQR